MDHLQYIINVSAGEHIRNVIEVGCGSGILTRNLATLTGWNIICIDPWVPAEGERHGIQFVRGYCEQMPFKNEKYDMVYSVFVLHETKHTLAIKEMHRVLRRGGILVIIDWNGHVRKALFERYLYPEDVKKELTRMGFKVLHILVEKDVFAITAKKL